MLIVYALIAQYQPFPVITRYDKVLIKKLELMYAGIDWRNDYLN